VFEPVLADAQNVEFSNKVNLLMQIVQMSLTAGDKLLIFSHRIPTLDFLGQVLENAGIKCARLDGQTKMKDRQSSTKNFNEGIGEDVFLISTQAGGTGFNLYGANRVVLFDFNFNPTWEEQAIGRAYRLGQKKKVFVYRLISAGTFEEALFDQTVFKLQLAGEVVEKKKTKSKASRIRQYIQMPTITKREDLSEQQGNDNILDAIIENMEENNELIHGIKLDTTYKEEDKEPLDDDDRKELAELVKQNKLMNTDPEAYRAQQLAKSYMPPATARAASYNSTISSRPGQMPASTAPTAHMLPPARTVSTPFNIPAAAKFQPPLQREPHGLPFPAGPPPFSMQGPNSNAALPNRSPNVAGGSASPLGRPHQAGK
jgi:superfamily II DNA/RNA helicase